MPPVMPDQSCQCFTLAEILSATNKFDDKLIIGRGGSAYVYECCGKIGSVREPAVKRLRSYTEEKALGFENERKVLSKLRHLNIVSLVGYCNEGEEWVLVYEYMPNGTLKDYLGNPALSWSRLMNICIGVSCGMKYMHMDTSTHEGIIHCDVKSSNILLDANFVAKVSDFGTSQVCQIDQTHTEVITEGVLGTDGYRDPSYMSTATVTRKSDVFSFGVVLYEVLSGRKTVGLTLGQIKQKKVKEIVDLRLRGQASNSCFKAFADIAAKCLHADPNERPSMAEVMGMLQSLLLQKGKKVKSFVVERGLLEKVKTFFTGKENVMVDDAGASSSAPNGAVSNRFVMQSGEVSSEPVMPLDGALGCESAPDGELGSDSAMVAECVVKSQVMNLSSVSHIPKQKKKKSKVVMPNNMVKITPAMLPDDVVEKKVVMLGSALVNKPVMLAESVVERKVMNLSRRTYNFQKRETKKSNAAIQSFMVESQPVMLPDSMVESKVVTPDDTVQTKLAMVPYGVVESKAVMQLDGETTHEVLRDGAIESNAVMLAECVIKSKSINLSIYESHFPKEKKKKSKDVMPDCTIESTPATVLDDMVAIKSEKLPDSVVGSLKTFTYSELARATKSFKHVHHSPYESFYRAWVNELTYAPTKCGVGLGIYVRKGKISTPKPDLKLEELNHPNLIPLLGYCLNDQDLFCVYELIPDTSLDKYLHQGGPDTTSVLSWDARLKIAAGAAEGLLFLHQRKHRAYSHFNSSFILVDTDFNARLSSYELVCPSTTSAFCLYRLPVSCLPPESSRFRLKSEIYDFGVVLLEILTGRKVYHDDVRERNLVEWAAPILAADAINLGRLMDPQLEGNYTQEGALKLARLVSKCLQPSPKKRPSMKEIVRILQSIK